ncbi:glycosyltransferase family 2 protein [Adlercreutzia murintestinalis]|uniref:glycosyltransferase family 2 protein n=1 Tax=Adlercreutzia murintestinalis TaxID=2941325 RepID=UPI00203CD2E2|nr:glycosyltransferase family 2 protein [Adlercreutzia murintestinalis]
MIPVINEGDRIQRELLCAHLHAIEDLCDIIICDGGSDNGSIEVDFLQRMGVNTLLVKRSAGKQGAQLQMGVFFAQQRGYDGIITVDGNNKDSVECVPLFIDALQQGYGFVQGSRFVRDGRAINTPLSRLIAVRAIHAPLTSLVAHHRFTDTTNGFRAYSASYLSDARVQPLRDVFDGYELLAYLAIRATQIGYKACEVPVERAYPSAGDTPTKIKGMKGNLDLLKVLFRAISGSYNPH